MQATRVFVAGAAVDVARGTTVVDVRQRSEFKHA